MRAMKKMLLACTAAGVMAVAVSASALCAQISVDNGATYAVDEAGKYTVSVAAEVLSGKSGQMTVLVTPKGALEKEGGLQDSDILYIDQLDANTENLFQNMGVKDALVEDEEYDVFVGGENVADDSGEASFYRTTFKVAKSGGETTLNKGDIDGNKKIELADATLLLYHAANIKKLSYTEEEMITLGDMNGDKKVELADATLLLYHAANIKKIAGLPDTY